MRVVVATAPQPVVSLTEAKQHLRVDHDDEDGLIEGYIAAATAHIDGPASYLGRCIGSQTLKLYTEAFPSCRLPFVLPGRPVKEVSSVEYQDASGAQQTLDGSRYKASEHRLFPSYGGDWPTARCDIDAICITYIAGYDAVPTSIKSAILLIVGDLHRFRDTVAPSQVTTIPMSPTVQNLLWPFQVLG